MKTINSKSIILALLMIATVPLAGCITLRSDTLPPAIYRLETSAPTEPMRLDVAAPTILLIAEPVMPAGFSSNNIILHFDGGRRQDHYAGALWSDDLSKLIRQYSVDDARATFPDLVIDTAQFGLSADYTLNMAVLDFQPVYEGAPEGIPMLHTRIRFALLDNQNNALLADIILERKAQAQQNNLSVITAGLERQYQEIIREAFGIMAPSIR